jgi:hypothetical protein
MSRLKLSVFSHMLSGLFWRRMRVGVLTVVVIASMEVSRCRPHVSKSLTVGILDSRAYVFLMARKMKMLKA